MYPESARINGVDYKINTDFKVALECFKIIEDDNIEDEERSLAIIYKLFGFIPDNDIDLFLDRAIKFLQCGETIQKQLSKEQDLDFFQDEKYITASFMSDYKLDLSKEDIHWWQYINLIQGLTENSILSRVRYIRNYDLSEIKDNKERQKMIEAKNSVALKQKKTKKQLEDDEFFNKLLRGEK